MKKFYASPVSKFTLLIIVCSVALVAMGQGNGNNSSTATAPELVFKNPVLKSGNANKEGAIYRFSNITAGVDAEIKLKKFSRNDIVMQSIDLAGMGWDKAFQPQFGLPGTVAPNQNWYIDFEMTFHEAGKNNKRKMDKAVFTALDVDGDGWSISEYAEFKNVSSTSYSPVSNLIGGGSIVFQANGQSTTPFTCPDDNISSIVQNCAKCSGSGVISSLIAGILNTVDCGDCDGSGKVYKQCKHAFPLTQTVNGPVLNFNNIDTAATQVMVTYTYLNKDKISFRYGAKSGAYSSNGSGIRLNSLWGKSFDLTPWVSLPVNFASFAVIYQKGNANLTWQAPHGEELSHFTVQRSTDGKDYTDIAVVMAGKTSSYAYTDKAVTSVTGVVYYRIVSVDFTKESQLSTVKMIKLTNPELGLIQISTYPNPVVNDLRISMPENWQGKPVMLQLFTINGAIVKNVQLGSASQTETMQVNGINKGLFVVKAVCGEETAQQRIVKN